MINPVKEFATSSGQNVIWRVARVMVVKASPARLDLALGKSADTNSYYIDIIDASYLASYAPVVGDFVQVLLHPSMNALVLGKIAR